MCAALVDYDGGRPCATMSCAARSLRRRPVARCFVTFRCEVSESSSVLRMTSRRSLFLNHQIAVHLQQWKLSALLDKCVRAIEHFQNRIHRTVVAGDEYGIRAFII
jgi:hypothetical protein